MKLINKKMTKLLLIGTLCTMAVAGLAGCGNSGQAGGKQFLTIATGGTTGTYYPLGGVLADIFNKDIANMNANAVSSGGSVANINMLKKGDADLAIAQNDIVSYAYNGTEMFEGKKVDTIRGIATLYPETVQIITLQDNPIMSVADLKGKKVAVGAVGSGAEANARQILAIYGLSYDDVDEKYLSFGEAASALKDKNIDAAFITAGAPTAAVQDIAATRSVKLIGLDDAHIDKLTAAYPFYTKMEVPADTYTGFNQNVNTVAVKAMLVASDKVNNNLGYEIAKAIFTNIDKLRASHAVGKYISVETATDAMPIPLNEGAEKYYNEVKK